MSAAVESSAIDPPLPPVPDQRSLRYTPEDERLPLRSRLDLREHPRQPWPHDGCPGPGMECMNPKCWYGKAALARKPIDDAITRERYPDLFPAEPQPR